MLRLVTAVLAALALAPTAGAENVRFSTFNASLNRSAAGQLITDLSTPANQQARNAAETIQRVRPDVLLINEFDYDAAGTALELFQDNYLSVSQNGAAPIVYPYRFAAESNTGIPSGFDLNNNGVIGGGDDAFGFGAYPGQFGMAVYSRYPIDPTRDPHLPALPLEGHAGRAAPGRPGDAGADGLVLARGARGLPALVEEPLGSADRDRQPGGALPDQPSDAARVRRARGPERHAELRRDPLLGGLHRAVAERVHLRRRRTLRRAAPRRAVRDRGRPELRSARRRQHPRLDPAAPRPHARELVRPADKPRGGGAGCVAGRHQPDAPLESGLRHGRLRRHRARATCGRTTSCRAGTSGARAAASSGRCEPIRSSDSWACSRSRRPTTGSSGWTRS